MVTGSNAVVAESLPNGTISNMPWRKAGVKYNQNEIYIDLVEEIDAIVEANGRVVSSDVSGSNEVKPDKKYAWKRIPPKDGDPVTRKERVNGIIIPDCKILN